MLFKSARRIAHNTLRAFESLTDDKSTVTVAPHPFAAEREFPICDRLRQSFGLFIGLCNRLGKRLTSL